MARKRRTIEEDHDHPSELWLVSYADMITVLFILMVILFAMSSLDSAKYEKMATSFNGVFNPNGQTVTEVTNSTEGGGDGKDGSEGSTVVETEQDVESSDKKMSAAEAKEQAQLEELKEELQEYLKEKKLNKEVTVGNTSRGVEIVFQDLALFPPGATNLSDKAQNTLAGIIPFLQSNERFILIEGHTDNVPTTNTAFRDNFQLSNERALSVLYFLKDNKVSAKRLSSSGYGEHQPVADNSTKAGRDKNRRVNMVILKNHLIDINAKK